MSEFAKQHPAHFILSCYNLSLSLWGQKIIRAENKGGFTLDDQSDAMDWESCACGSASNPVVMRNAHPDGLGLAVGPLDIQLKELGQLFYNAVYQDDFMRAARLLVAIERRAADNAMFIGLGDSAEPIPYP